MLLNLPPHPGTANNLEVLMSTPDEPTETSEPNPYTDPLDDVFGSAPPSPAPSSGDNDPNVEPTRHHQLEPSDIPRLRTTHVTNGYREGIAASKEQHIQQGFDEGYALGAELGLKVGWCLGALEGMVRAMPAAAGSSQTDVELETIREDEVARKKKEKREGVRDLLKRAEEELGMEKLFGREYFGADGIWLYNVPSQEQNESEDEDKVTFAQVAEAHPVIAKWTGRTTNLACELGLVLQ